jgi:hypothetical protein
MKIHKLIITTLLILLIIIVGCKKEIKDNNDDSITIEKINKEIEDIEKITSIDYIQELYKQDKIDIKDVALIELINLYSQDSLPKKFNVENVKTNPMWAKHYIVNNWDSFNDEEKNKFMPYYVPAYNINSIHQIDKDIMLNKITDSLSIIPSVNAQTDIFQFKNFKIDSSGRSTNVFYKIENKEQAEWVGNAFIYAYPMFEELLEIRPKKEINISIVPISDYGLAWSIQDSGVNSCFIEIRKGLNKKQTEAVTVHELFHCFQFIIPLKYERKNIMWLMEATATWSEHFIYPEYNTEWETHEIFFSNLGGSMLYYGDNREYATYIWPLYVSQKLGNSAVKDMLFNAKSSGSGVEAILKVPEYFDLFKEYGLYAWNQNIAYGFVDNPSFPQKWNNGEERKPFGKKSYYLLHMKKDKIDNIDWSHNSFSHYYTHLKFDKNIKKIEFTFSPVANRIHPIQALIKTENEWYYEDFHGLEDRIFCIHENNKIEEIVLITTNSVRDKHTPKITISTKGECKPEWRGYFKVSWTAEKTIATEGGLESAQKTYYYQGNYISQEILRYDEDKKSFEIIDAKVSYNSNSKEHIDYSGGCGWKYNHLDETSKGSHSFIFNKNEYPPIRMAFLDNSKLSFNAVAISKQGVEWITSNDLKKTLHESCHSEEIRRTEEPSTFKYEQLTLPTENKELIFDISSKSKEIKGTKEVNIKSSIYGDYTAVVDFYYSYG